MREREIERERLREAERERGRDRERGMTHVLEEIARLRKHTQMDAEMEWR
jgi:hypothetical protein